MVMTDIYWTFLNVTRNSLSALYGLSHSSLINGCTVSPICWKENHAKGSQMTRPNSHN